MNERTIVKTIVALLAIVAVFVTGNTDLIYLLASLLFFGLCVAYAEWCERL
jgi:hypothetical protein